MIARFMFFYKPGVTLARLVDFSVLGEHLSSDSNVLIFASTNGQLLGKGRYPKRIGLYLIDAFPLALSVRLSQARVSN